jgi:hypothetical protein
MQIHYIKIRLLRRKKFEPVKTRRDNLLLAGIKMFEFYGKDIGLCFSKFSQEIDSTMGKWNSPSLP